MCANRESILTIIVGRRAPGFAAMPTSQHVWTPGLDSHNFARSTRPHNGLPRSSPTSSMAGHRGLRTPPRSPGGLFGSTGSSFSSSVRPADLPGTGEWSPFHVRSAAWTSGSLLTIAREHHAAIERLKQAEAAATPERPSGPRHERNTQARTLQPWPRGNVPEDELAPRARRRTSSRFVSPAGSSKDYGRVPTDRLYGRILPPGPYLWAGAGGPPGSSRKGMVFR
jgi:hypothetical protein